MLMCHYYSAGQNHYLMAANKSYNVAKSNYLVMMITNENCNHKEIKSRLNSEILDAIHFRICLPGYCPRR
jgi:hypothetical protein